MTDLELLLLVRQAQAGCPAAFNQLVQQFEGTVFAIVMRRLRNSAEAAEVTQDVFVRMLRKLDQLREPERFVGWLKRIAIRLSINRAVRRPHETTQAPETFDAFRTRPDVPIDGLVRQEQAREVKKGLSRLRKLDRETLVAFYFEGQSLKEMSDRFSSPVGTIKRRLHTARARLKDALGELQPA
ncbi:RNA polymerase sigma factor [Planctomyces sp. SH-PL14]|uniref:RNA polymerase sigma factor n=1 Tax=Planctomyces sp. SH-PL14 TaxID=1632864 RepID=UPI00078C696C|nr:sigma-70 family RNA polymerase sigma factor [Planctomyces sp. SH-PL14]AMV16787.1 ECF RNA polymerase sigma factor SigW [Planctomyces sp. SH-PL14]